MKKTINILLLLISSFIYSQNNSESEIFRKIIDHEIGNCGLYIQCDKMKTFFELEDFIDQTGLDVPFIILKEIERNAQKSNAGNWNSELLYNLNYGTELIKSKKCLSKNDVEKLFETTGKRQSIISISEPIFDDNYENCIVSVTFSKFKGSAYGHSFFLKKVYGIWTIIVEYETWMT